MNLKVIFNFTLFFVLIIAISLISCGSKRTFEKQSPTQRFASFSILEIPDFTSLVPRTPEQLSWSMPNEIEKQIKDKNLFLGVSRSPVDISDEVLVAEGTITEITPIEWYKQLVNNVTIVVNVKFVQKSTGNTVSEAEFEGKAKWGIFGGSRVFADIRVTDEIVAYIERKYR